MVHNLPRILTTCDKKKQDLRQQSYTATVEIMHYTAILTHHTHTHSLTHTYSLGHAITGGDEKHALRWVVDDKQTKNQVWWQIWSKKCNSFMSAVRITLLLLNPCFFKHLHPSQLLSFCCKSWSCFPWHFHPEDPYLWSEAERCPGVKWRKQRFVSKFVKWHADP